MFPNIGVFDTLIASRFLDPPSLLAVGHSCRSAYCVIFDPEMEREIWSTVYFDCFGDELFPSSCPESDTGKDDCVNSDSEISRLDDLPKVVIAARLCLARWRACEETRLRLAVTDIERRQYELCIEEKKAFHRRMQSPVGSDALEQFAHGLISHIENRIYFSDFGKEVSKYDEKYWWTLLIFPPKNATCIRLHIYYFNEQNGLEQTMLKVVRETKNFAKKSPEIEELISSRGYQERGGFGFGEVYTHRTEKLFADLFHKGQRDYNRFRHSHFDQIDWNSLNGDIDITSAELLELIYILCGLPGNGDEYFWFADWML